MLFSQRLTSPPETTHGPNSSCRKSSMHRENHLHCQRSSMLVGLHTGGTLLQPPVQFLLLPTWTRFCQRMDPLSSIWRMVGRTLDSITVLIPEMMSRPTSQILLPMIMMHR